DGQQDDGAKQGYQERADAEVVLVDGSSAEQRRQQPSTKQGADDAHHDIEQQALLSVGAHDETGEPAEDAAYYDPDNEVHAFLLRVGQRSVMLIGHANRSCGSIV